ncbi:MAG: hypothetical protein K5985_03215 [Lachnospiraceae bacterium]|nr:hypothetical protein [Lachnospiraceae bacterium]
MSEEGNMTELRIATREVIAASKGIYEEHSGKIFSTMKSLLCISIVAKREGWQALEKLVNGDEKMLSILEEDMQKCVPEFLESFPILKRGIYYFINGMDGSIYLDVLMNKYYAQHYTGLEAYLNILGINMLHEMREARKTRIMWILMRSFVPFEYGDAFDTEVREEGYVKEDVKSTIGLWAR